MTLQAADFTQPIYSRREPDDFEPFLELPSDDNYIRLALGVQSSHIFPGFLI